MVKGAHDFLNFFKYDDEDGDYPEIEPFNEDEGINLQEMKFIPLNLASRVPRKDRKNYVVHMFLSDYLFERVWNRLNPMTEFLSEFGAVCQPDFSTYTDMPLPMQIWNIYRKCFVGNYWQKHGIKVLPSPSWSDERSYGFCFNGMPKGGTIIMSTVGVMNNKEAQRLFKKGFEKFIEECEPDRIIWYGKQPEWADKNDQVIPHEAHQRFKKLEEEKAAK